MDSCQSSTCERARRRPTLYAHCVLGPNRIMQNAYFGPIFSIVIILAACTYSKSDGNAWWLAKLNKELDLRCNCILPDEVTIVQHFSLDRLPFLAAQCNQWMGGIAAAIYVPLVNGSIYVPPPSDWHGRSLAHALAHVTQLYNSLTVRGCKLELTVFSEELPQINDWYSYPANTLRNMALDIAHTEVCGDVQAKGVRIWKPHHLSTTTQLVLLLDADFLVAPQQFGRLLHNPTNRSGYDDLYALFRSGRNLLVLPAFHSMVDYATPEAQHVLVHGDKHALASAVTNQHMAPFQAVFHRDTNYTKWWEAEEVYEVEFGGAGTVFKLPGEFEPYVIALRKQLPSYDERFRGYNYNKLSYFYYLHKLGFQFHVHPWAYVAHMPHAEQHRRKEQMAHSNDKYQMMAHMFIRELPDMMHAKRYQPVIAEQPFPLGARAVYNMAGQ